MTYQQWLTEMNKGRGTELQGMKRLIKESAARCSRATRDALEPLLNDLDELFAGPAGEVDPDDSSDLFFEQQAPEDRPPVSESSYGFLSEAVGNEFVAMMNRFEPPLELLGHQGVPNAFLEIFNALGILDRTFPVTDFQRTWEREEAVEKDADTYAAQIMAMKDMKEEASLKSFLEAAVGISIWKKKPSFKYAMKDQNILRRLTEDDAIDGFLNDMQSAFEKYDVETAKTFKELSGELAQIYRKNQKYADFELRMNALRAVAGEKEKDRAKWDDVKITVREFSNKVRELQEAQMDKAPDEYQNELADSGVMPADLKTQSIHNMYNVKPVFMEDFNNNNAKEPCYRRQDFDAHMKEIDIDGFSFGSSPLTDDEFGSLSFLAVIDPNLLGSFISLYKKSVPVEDPDLDLAVMNFAPAAIGYGDHTIEKDGKTIYGPDDRVGRTMELCIAPAREKVRRALYAWKQGDKTVLGKILAEGVQLFVNDRSHSVDYNLTGLNSDEAILANMTKGAVDLLRRDKDLMQAAKDAGLKEETLTELEGICMANRIEKAANEAKKRLGDSAVGLRMMSAFEKEQCVTAIQRFEAMINDIRQAEKAWEESEEYKKLDKEYEDEFEKLFEQAEGNFTNHPELKIKDLRSQYKKTHGQIKIMKRPGVFMTLGKKGPAGLDEMLPENRLNPKKAGTMSSIELAQEMGLAEKRKITTTAKEIYDQQTREYKAGRINYTLYEARLKVMREVTGGNKDAKVDLKALDDAIQIRLERNLGPLEKGINEITKEEYAGDLGTRLKHILNIYGKNPEADPNSVGSGYTQEQFDQLKPIKGDHLYIGGNYLNQFDFAVLAVAATQADPKIGGVYLVDNKGDDRTEKRYVNAMENPTHDDAAALRSFYITDLDQGSDSGARKNMGAYFAAVIEPAREKVDSALKAFKHGNGSTEAIGKIIGLGIKNILSHSMLVNGDSGKWTRDAVIEGNILGKLAEIAERDPKLQDEVMRNIDRDDLNRAKGMAVIYDIARSSEQAREKLTAAANGETQLTEIERRACVELMLRGKVLADLGTKHAKNKYTNEVEKKIADFYAAHPLQDDPQKEALYSAQAQSIEYDNVGLPDYVKILGEKGPVFARELLDDKMPSRDAFMKLSDKEILEMTAAKSGSENDPFAKEEYTKPVFNEEHHLDKSMREYKAREAASPQKVL